MTAILKNIFRFPIKGFSGEELKEIKLCAPANRGPCRQWRHKYSTAAQRRFCEIMIESGRLRLRNGRQAKMIADAKNQTNIFLNLKIE